MNSFRIGKEIYYDGDLIRVRNGELVTEGQLFIGIEDNITHCWLLSNDIKFDGGPHGEIADEAKEARGYKYTWWLTSNEYGWRSFHIISKIEPTIDNYELI